MLTGTGPVTVIVRRDGFASKVVDATAPRSPGRGVISIEVSAPWSVYSWVYVGPMLPSPPGADGSCP